MLPLLKCHPECPNLNTGRLGSCTTSLRRMLRLRHTSELLSTFHITSFANIFSLLIDAVSAEPLLCLCRSGVPFSLTGAVLTLVVAAVTRYPYNTGSTSISAVDAALNDSVRITHLLQSCALVDIMISTYGSTTNVWSVLGALDKSPAVTFCKRMLIYIYI